MRQEATRRPQKHVVPMKRLKCPVCNSVAVKVTSTPKNDAVRLERWCKCDGCKTPFLTIWD
jgi:hypothetical protein